LTGSCELMITEETKFSFALFLFEN